ncbi:homoserine O-succinyltransferase [Candidatus Tachikawaea gelatinosa]|uniref:Homoserine O-succinyltransferase n=1 Tax=Candidatus Tachikawaea gelatinosa TaxID=1410383 RepID=A0A090ALS1_9ENTR|nr:homoserine O-succinyltransferase [Candidatus Tachikawaea gelatinosa]BAP58599.1 homoserine O-succinyltransferase [Candidatus Tachikawaea gelatinosa]
MSVRVLKNLPAINFLKKENILIKTICDKNIKKFSVIKILILNLMPKKIETENQFIRLLSNFPLDINVRFLYIGNRTSKYTSIEHFHNFYDKFEDIKSYFFDGLIITGAPFGLLDFSEVSYWKEIKLFFKWIKKHIKSTLLFCWSAQAALKILYNIPKKIRKKKLFGIYKHVIIHHNHLLTKGFDEYFFVPHSRYADFSKSHIIKNKKLKIIAEVENKEIYLMTSQDDRFIFVTGHPEYDSLTLFNEYRRDIENKIPSEIPCNYFPQDNPKLSPYITWRSHGQLLLNNWLQYYVI